MKKRSFRSTFVSVILVITVAISIVNLAVYGINIKKIRQVEVLKMKTAGERIDDMITISLNNIKGLKQICCTDNYARNILLKNNEKNDIGTKFENQNYMDNALKHIASMDTLILRATIVNKYGNIYCTDTSIPEEYVKTIRNMTKEWMLFEGKEDEYYYGGLQGDNANILTFLYPLHTYGNSYFYMANLDSVTKKAAQMAKQKGSKIFMDADSYTDELLDAISWIDIFIGSEFVYEKMLEAGKSVKENCEYLYNKGPEIVIFTFGEKGCAGISKEGFFEIPAFDVDVKDTVGAGDVFHGAFLAAIVKGLSPKDAARFASGVAAIKCTRIGGRAGIPNWEVTDNFLETGEIDYREIDERVKKYGRGIEYV